MTPVPLDLPLRPSDAAAVGNLIFDHAEHRPFNDELRTRIASRASALRLASLTPYFGSLERDPVHPSTYYLAIDGSSGEPLLLHIARANAPTSSLFAKPLLVGRMPRAGGPEMVINCLPFGPPDRENIDKFAAATDQRLLPRPLGPRPAIVIESDCPARDFPRAFDGFRAVLKRTGKNVAALAGPDACPGGMWAAIRAGWRDGYSIGAAIPALANPNIVKEVIRRSAGCSRFTVSLGGFEPSAEDPAEHMPPPVAIDGKTYSVDPQAACALLPALKVAAAVHEWIRQARSALKTGRSFDLELTFEGGRLTTPADLLFCLHWMKTRGQAVQLAAPQFAAGSVQGLAELAAVARHFGCTLSIASQSSHTADVLAAIGRATAGRVHYRLVPGEADLAEVIQETAAGLFA